MIAFLLPHASSKSSFDTFVISVDSLENLTNIDFFPQLEDDLENKLEATKGDLNNWVGESSSK